jgi:hypothetical protein
MGGIGLRGGKPHRRMLPSFNFLGSCNFKWLRVAETAHPTTIALLVKTTLSSRYGRGRCESRHQGAGPQMILAVLDHALHANSTLVDRVDLAT